MDVLDMVGPTQAKSPLFFGWKSQENNMRMTK